MSGSDLLVVAIDERSRIGDRSGAFAVEPWAALAEATLRAENVTAGELNLVFVDSTEMARLNAEHLGRDGPTDVLSFPLDGVEADPLGPGPALVGDVVICPAYAQARAAGGGAEGVEVHTTGSGAEGEEELALLVVHGVLHTLGYDHDCARDAARMQARERELLAAHHRSCRDWS